MDKFAMFSGTILERAKGDQLLNALLTRLLPILTNLVVKAAKLGTQYIPALLKVLQQKIKLYIPAWVLSLLRPYEVVEVWQYVDRSPSSLYDQVKTRFENLSKNVPCFDINFTQRAIHDQVKDDVIFQKRLERSVWDEFQYDKNVEGVRVLITRHEIDEIDEEANEKEGWQEKYRGHRYTIHIPVRQKAQLEPYLQSLAETYKPVLKIYRNLKGYDNWDRDWDSFQHPFKMDNLALPKEQKTLIQGDVESFKGDGEFFRSVGKPWKRGYLLYGPPGTGKSSLIAAIANHLEYSLYELDLSKVESDEHLIHLIESTEKGSIIVIEDIDCIGIDLSRSRDGQKKKLAKDIKLTLSGILNALDGLRSGQTDEKLFIFTSNHPEQLDPALIRAGRMDMHIELGYCGYEAFAVLMKNYLRIDNHEKLPQIQELFDSTCVTRVTPAAIAEILFRYRSNHDRAFEKTIELLKKRPEI